MLSSERFHFDTPNSIDAGDMPPSQPGGRDAKSVGSSSSSSRHTSPTTSLDTSFLSDASSSDANYSPERKAMLPPTYLEERKSSRRLLRDINDLELSPLSTNTETIPLSSGDPYDPYENNNNNNQNQNFHSLPTVEEARTYAANVMGNNNNSGYNEYSHDERIAFTVPSSMPSSSSNRMPMLGRNRSVQLESPSQREHRHVLLKQVTRTLCFPVAALAFLVIGLVLLATSGGNVDHNGNGSVNVIDSDGSSGGTRGGSTGANGSGGGATASPRYHATVQALINWQITEPETLEESSPQNLAAQWIADHDALQVTIPDTTSENSIDTTETHFRFVQRYVLAVMFIAWHGDEWQDHLQWTSDIDECLWNTPEQVQAWHNRTYVRGVNCHTDLHVSEIFLHENKLRGNWVNELQHLSHLEILSLSNNELDGSLPANVDGGWDKLQKLRYLDLAYNGFTGSLPSELASTSLEILGLSDNDFTGPIPQSFSYMSSLKTLALDDNNFNGTLEFAQMLTGLEYFYADRNWFEATVDDHFMSNHQNLQELDLSANLLSSDSMPQHLLRHPTLRVLDLANNRLRGRIFPTDNPANVPANTVLTFLSFHANGLTGPIPPALSKFARLQHLDLAGNDFSGTIPGQLSLLSELTYLFVGYNQLNLATSFPIAIGSMINLRELSLAGCQLQSVIPAWIGTILTNLTLLDLSNNEIQGSVPEELWQLPHLTYLFLDHNQLTGAIPVAGATIPNNTNLEVVMLHKNQNLGGNATAICGAAAPDPLSLMGIDCGDQWECTDECCPVCCEETSTTCFDDDERDYMVSIEGLWEYGFTRDSNGYDPYLLDEETGLMTSDLESQKDP